MDRAGAGGGHADAGASRELGVAHGLEGAHLLMTGLDELRNLLRISVRPCGNDPVDAVAGIGEDLVDLPLHQSMEQVPCDRRVCHVVSSSERAPKGSSPDRKSTRLNSSHVAIAYAVF